ncbi:MAG: hypothetical protein ACRERC_25860 [Candidatus Binatia bacterium]
MRYAIWGSELSPYTLKLRALLTAAAVPFRNLPEDGTRGENLRAQWRIGRGKRRRTIERWPQLDPLDEYPLVPFLLEGDGRVLYDSSALAAWLDRFHPPRRGPLVPDDAALAFIAQLIDEAFDEIGLYVVHHARWVVSAATNDAGQRLAREFARVLPPGGQGVMARSFARRQVRRLPYLFSVAPAGFSIDGLDAALIPPARPGFPPTHALLAGCWAATLAAFESLLAVQPYLLGDRFTVADASAYGQLSMNLKDRTAAEHLQRRAPTTFAWLCAIRDRRHVGSAGALRLSDRLAPLLQLIARTFLPLMAQNARAFDAARAAGETVFNEAAFDRGRALYDGTLNGQPFRAVAKSFQVRVWRELRAAWQALPDDARATLTGAAPELVQLAN